MAVYDYPILGGPDYAWAAWTEALAALAGSNAVTWGSVTGTILPDHVYIDVGVLGNVYRYHFQDIQPRTYSMQAWIEQVLTQPFWYLWHRPFAWSGYIRDEFSAQEETATVRQMRVFLQQAWRTLPNGTTYTHIGNATGALANGAYCPGARWNAVAFASWEQNQIILQRAGPEQDITRVLGGMQPAIWGSIWLSDGNQMATARAMPGYQICPAPEPEYPQELISAVDGLAHALDESVPDDRMKLLDGTMEYVEARGSGDRPQAPAATFPDALHNLYLGVKAVARCTRTAIVDRVAIDWRAISSWR
jgi:hypothetical protein